ncbi:MFS transporter [Actinotalea sp.]|uniref:MFS transporter n=1 Tax=Actinotalea sp. TaxID=1872145 RepID=UPI00356A8C5E
MPTPSASAVPRSDRRARVAVAVLFFTNGALFANLVPRYPEIKADLGLSNALYGLSVAAFPTGAIVAGLGASALIRRFGSARVAVGGTWCAAVALLVAAILPSAPGFAAALLVAGAMDAITDVAQNAHGLRVQRRYRRSILNSFHAVWSVGAVTGGAMAAGAIALDLPRGTHLAISTVVLSLVALAASRFCLPGAETDQTAPGHRGTDGHAPGRRIRVGASTIVLIGALVLIASAGSVVEDAGSSWATLYLSDSLGAAAAVASFGFIAVVGAQFVGRLLGDRLVDRFGQRAVARAGGVLVAVGMGSALAVPTIPGTMVGLAAAGLGIATLVPAAMHAADEIPGLRPGTGLTVLSWLMRLGFLLSPPVVGAIADATSLRAGLLVVPVAGLAVVLLAGVLAGRARPSVSSPAAAATLT